LQLIEAGFQALNADLLVIQHDLLSIQLDQNRLTLRRGTDLWPTD
jgi:hypothetical protein